MNKHSVDVVDGKRTKTHARQQQEEMLWGHDTD